MKIYIIVFFLINSHSILSQTVEGKIIYIASTKKALEFGTGSNKNNLKIENQVNEIYKNANDVTTILNFNEELSEYYVKDKLGIGNEQDINITHIMAGSEKTFYTFNSTMNYTNNTLDCYLLGECFLIENTLPKWILKQETKMIQGFLCYLAVLINPGNGKQSLEAWYTPKLPYQYGVMEYYGLPGVILELNRNTITITAIKIELNPIEGIEIIVPKNIKKLTQKDFKDLTRKSMPEFYKRN